MNAGGSLRLALLSAAALAVVVMLVGAPAVAASGTEKTPAVERAERRAYDGAPPVIGHEDFDMVCIECHSAQGMAVDGYGFAPPSPHVLTAGLSAMSRCTQCHVFQQTDDLFAENSFVGLEQDLRSGGRLHPFAPPTIPHKTFMRENCTACHSGQAAREEIRTSHPERIRCRQCHVPTTTRELFSTGATP
jgi:cytochrome c-type protein NapB